MIIRDYKNILIVRTDRVGDVVLTTPAILALREAYMGAKISILVSPQTRDIIENNPCLDEIIIDDKNGAHKGFWGFLKLVFGLRKRRFDLAVIFHTKKRTNFLCFLAGIPVRLGYKNNKFGFLLTKKIKDTRIEGTRHEAEYCLDLLSHIGVKAVELKLLMPVKKESQDWAQKILGDNDVVASERLIAVHPGASCISKRWLPERFAGLINQLTHNHFARVVLVGGPETKNIAKEIKSALTNPVVDLTGETSVSQLAGILKKCQLLISNDSGPVHVACAVGTPVISIFGRNQAGLSPARWRPLGKNDIFIHKEVGCKVCLAHNCDIDFECLKAIAVDDVLSAVKTLLKVSSLTA